MTEKQGKIWGTTALLFSNPFVRLHLLDVLKGGFCSEHRHARKTNLFFVLSGKIRVSIWKDGKDELEDQTELEAGQSTAVGPGLWHKFEALERSTVLELYESASIEEDIERRSVGGLG